MLYGIVKFSVSLGSSVVGRANVDRKPVPGFRSCHEC